MAKIEVGPEVTHGETKEQQGKDAGMNSATTRDRRKVKGKRS